jgi:hypothetical protein
MMMTMGQGEGVANSCQVEMVELGEEHEMEPPRKRKRKSK